MPASFLMLLFWTSLGGVLYGYVGFPALVTVLAAAKRRRTETAGELTVFTTVTVIIPAYNEQENLGVKIRNVLAADYPRSLMDVVVVSDASTDGTDGIARAFAGQGVRLLVQETRRGKSAALNRAIELTRGDIVVFTDANAGYPPGAIGTLLKHFRDPKIGLVTGYTRYTSNDGGAVAKATNIYTVLERLIKRAESRWGCCVGADGAIFAMRRSLYRALREDDINDLVLPLGVIDQGYQCVFAEDAFCLEDPGKKLESEFRRQSRITNRTLRALWRNTRLLNPFRFPVFAFFLFSHKIVRLVVPIFLMLSVLTIFLLTPTGGVYPVAAIGAMAALALPLLSKVFPQVALSRFGWGRLPHFLNIFLTINVAVLCGWWRFVSGHRDVMWHHDRSPAG